MRVDMYAWDSRGLTGELWVVDCADVTEEGPCMGHPIHEFYLSIGAKLLYTNAYTCLQVIRF